MKNLHLKIFVAVWIAVFLSCFFIPAHLLESYWSDTRIFSFATVVWITCCIAVFWAGTFVEKSIHVGATQSTSSMAAPFVPYARFVRSFKMAKFILGLSAAVIGFRFLWCVKLSGGLGSTLRYMLTEPTEFKFQYWQATNIHGLGMVAEAVVGCTIFAFSALALTKKYRSNSGNYRAIGYDKDNLHKLYRTCVKYLAASLFLIVLYLLLSNERIAFVGGFLGGLVAYFLILRRLPLKSMAYIAGFLLLLWVFIEAGRRQYLGSQSLDFIVEYGKNQLLLYFVAGLRNVDTALLYFSDQSYGWFTLNFLLSPFKLDEMFLVVVDNYYAFTPYSIRPGYGVIPIFGTAFADFHLAGSIYFFVIGFVYQRLHRQAIEGCGFLANQIYAYFLVALLLSFVIFLPCIFRFWVNLLVLLVIDRSVGIHLPRLVGQPKVRTA